MTLQELLEHVILPNMCHNDNDERLWIEDPYEYIRLKFDTFNDAVDPIIAAAVFLRELVRKRVCEQKKKRKKEKKKKKKRETEREVEREITCI